MGVTPGITLEVVPTEMHAVTLMAGVFPCPLAKLDSLRLVFRSVLTLVNPCW